MTYLIISSEFLDKRVIPAIDDISEGKKEFDDAMLQNPFYDDENPNEPTTIYIDRTINTSNRSMLESFFTFSGSIIKNIHLVKKVTHDDGRVSIVDANLSVHIDETGVFSEYKINNKKTKSAGAINYQELDRDIEVDGFVLLVAVGIISNQSVYFDKVQRQQRRLIQRDLPFVSKGDSYYILSLDQKRRNSGDLQDVSCKKRYHFCRGHYRQYEDKKTWIKGHWRGDESLGIIRKDYAA